MKKLTKLFSMLLVAAMSVMVACGTPDEPQTPNTPEDPQKPDTPQTAEPSVSITPIDAGEDWLKFDVVAANLTRVFYVAIEANMFDIIEGFGAEWITTYGQYIPNGNNTTTTITFDGRAEGTNYYVYAAGLKGDTYVISERVEMRTLDKSYTTTTLPEADFCNISLAVLSSMDRYSFALSDESNNLHFTFNLYTAKGCNGAIPTGTYTVGAAIPNNVELTSMTLESQGLPIVISDGTLDVELYNDGKNIRLNGNFTLVSLDKATFEYDGPVTITGIDSGETGDNDTITFTKAILYTSSEKGWYEIQFSPAVGNSMLDLQFHSNPSKKYLTSGTYPVFGSAAAAAAAGSANSWIFVEEGAPAGSFYQDDMSIPSIILVGTDSYVQVNTNMDNGEDWYDITFSLKVKSLADMKESTLKATYKGKLGFTVTNDTPTLRMESMYVDITSEGTTHKLNFHGGYTTMVATIEGALPEIGDDYVWYDIVSGRFSDAYATIYDHPISNGRIAIKRFPDASDASDDGKVKAFYAFMIEGVLNDVTIKDQETGVTTTNTYDLVGEWKSFQTKYVSEW